MKGLVLGEIEQPRSDLSTLFGFMDLECTHSHYLVLQSKQNLQC